MIESVEPVPDGPRPVGRGRVVGLGLALLAVSVLTIVLVPVAVAIVAAWWVAEDARSAKDAPGGFGKTALALLAFGWSVTALLVLAADAHFGCGGTLGGFGESASARLDEDCADRRSWRVLVGVASVLVGTGLAGRLIRRWSNGRLVENVPPQAVTPALIVVGCVAIWSALIAVLVVS